MSVPRPPAPDGDATTPLGGIAGGVYGLFEGLGFVVEAALVGVGRAKRTPHGLRMAIGCLVGTTAAGFVLGFLLAPGAFRALGAIAGMVAGFVVGGILAIFLGILFEIGG